MTLTLTADRDRATIMPQAGGRLASLVAGGAERLVGPPQDLAEASPTGWGSFVMAPWAGRLDRGALPFHGRDHPQQPNRSGHALHGLCYDRAWDIDDAGDGHALLSCPLSSPRWPFGGTVRQRVALRPGHLELTVEALAGERAMPFAAGWHPWFLRPSEGDLRVTVRADERLELRDDLVPTGRLLPVSADADLRHGPALGDRRLDHVYAFAASPALVEWPDLRLTMAFDPPLATVVVHTPPRGVCVEPQSAWPNAPALAAAGESRTGLLEVPAGGAAALRTVWSWRA